MSDDDYLMLLRPFGSDPLSNFAVHGKQGIKVVRVMDDILRSSVIQLKGNTSSGFIVAPKPPRKTLAVSHPVLNLFLSSDQDYFSLDLGITDRHDDLFCVKLSTFSKKLSVSHSHCRIPLKLTEGWNYLTIDMKYHCKRLFNKEFSKFQSIKIFPNCKLRKIFFSKEVLNEVELPHEYGMQITAKRVYHSCFPSSHQKILNSPTMSPIQSSTGLTFMAGINQNAITPSRIVVNVEKDKPKALKLNNFHPLLPKPAVQKEQEQRQSTWIRPFRKCENLNVDQVREAINKQMKIIERTTAKLHNHKLKNLDEKTSATIRSSVHDHEEPDPFLPLNLNHARGYDKRSQNNRRESKHCQVKMYKNETTDSDQASAIEWSTVDKLLERYEHINPTNPVDKEPNSLQGSNKSPKSCMLSDSVVFGIEENGEEKERKFSDSTFDGRLMNNLSDMKGYDEEEISSDCSNSGSFFREGFVGNSECNRTNSYIPSDDTLNKHSQRPKKYIIAMDNQVEQSGDCEKEEGDVGPKLSNSLWDQYYVNKPKSMSVESVGVQGQEKSRENSEHSYQDIGLCLSEKYNPDFEVQEDNLSSIGLMISGKFDEDINAITVSISETSLNHENAIYSNGNFLNGVSNHNNNIGPYRREMISNRIMDDQKVIEIQDQKYFLGSDGSIDEYSETRSRNSTMGLKKNNEAGRKLGRDPYAEISSLSKKGSNRRDHIINEKL
ncbi:hypothetical protein ACOME3_001721 [Neoechinorhynchus agilis]